MSAARSMYGAQRLVWVVVRSIFHRNGNPRHLVADVVLVTDDEELARATAGGVPVESDMIVRVVERPMKGFAPEFAVTDRSVAVALAIHHLVRADGEVSASLHVMHVLPDVQSAPTHVAGDNESLTVMHVQCPMRKAPSPSALGSRDGSSERAGK